MGNGLVDVAIGLALMYLLLSLIGTIANEYISGILKLRASNLSAGIKKLIDDKDLWQVFKDHGLIQTSQKQPNPADEKATATLKDAQKRAAAPDATANDQQLAASAMKQAEAATVDTAKKAEITASYLSGRTVAMALLDSLNPGNKVPVMADIEAAIEKLPPSNIKDVLTTAITTAGTDIDKARENVAAWFDSSMDRLGGVYKRNLQVISLIVGMVIAALLNADTFTVATALWKDTNLQQGIEKQASAIAQVGEDKLTKEKLGQLLQDLRPLPIGWSEAAWAEFHIDGKGLLRIIGWFLTALAITLGAPFWFDTLNKVMNLRSAGAKPKTEDAPKK